LDALSAKFQAEGAKILRTFKSDVFTGLSIQSAEHNIDSLQEVTEVSQAWPITKIRLAPVQPIVSFSDDASAANYSMHQYTGVQRAHDAGLYGKGAVIAIVDTGVDYTHKAVS
jgi:subtilisin family serine protease